MGQQVLVTGASGYIGQHLVNSLHKDGMAVRGFARGPKPPILSDIEWQSGDVRNLTEVEQAVQGCEAIMHLACLPLGPSFDDPLRDFSINALGTLNVLQAVRTTGVRRIVYTSTAQVYGFVERLPIAEDSPPPKPTSPYAASKLCGEVLCTTFARCYELNTIVLRLFNVYGLSLDSSLRPTVETIFVRRVAQGQPPVIKDNSEEARDFIHVSDVVRAIRLALHTDVTGKVINIGSGVMTSLEELAKTIIEIAGAQINLAIEKSETRPLRLQADTRRARQVLGFEPKISLAEGLAELLNHFRSTFTEVSDGKSG